MTVIKIFYSQIREFISDAHNMFKSHNVLIKDQ